MELENVEYVGFWARTFATIIDTIVLMVVAFPIAWILVDTGISQQYAEFGPLGNLIGQLAVPAIVILLWMTIGATPGKMLISAKVVDAETGNNLTGWQSVGRYLAYFVAYIPLFLGVIWVGFDRRKQGWHDKLAGTVVIHVYN